MWDMEVLLVLRLCCNCTYGNNSAAAVCLETLLCSFTSALYRHHHRFVAGEVLSGVLSALDASTCQLLFSVLLLSSVR